MPKRPQLHQPHPAVVVDTNILMALPAIHKFKWGVEQPITIYILDAVVDELRGLTRDKENTARAEAAQHTLSVLDALQKRAPPDGIPLLNATGRLIFAKVPQDIPPPLDPTSVDHQQIALAQAHLKASPEGFCAIVTNDQEMANIAISASPAVPVIRPGTGAIGKAIRRQLATQIYWWQLFHCEEAAAKQSHPVKPARPVSKTRPDPQARLRRVVCSLYGRVRSSRHRAILSVAPLEARLALTAHVVRTLTRRKSRVIFLFVEGRSEAEYWAGELHRQCRLQSDAVLVFGERGLPRVRGTKVVVYCYSQIESRFNQHAARFAKAGRRITTVVDGCDLLDPVWIAMLLFGCDQFIGFTRHPLGHAQAVGGRMLATFFEQRTVATYTFADAEEDGWLRPFDVLRHPVTFQEDEFQTYREVNDRFITVHNKVSRRYPELNEASDFWESLHRILERAVDHQAASLFTLREQREELAQMARAKCEVVVRLLSEAGSPARCLICDLERLWTAVLRRTLAEQGMTVEVLERSFDADTAESLWRRFERGKVDCLILQDVPPVRFVGARINRLIVMTPLTPLASLAAIVDWVLSHALSGPAVCVDLLYTSGTPEQQAMVDFADTCCGLRFGR